MALTDVSKNITFYQRLCQFAEEFTEEHHDRMVQVLQNLFRSDRADGAPGPDVLEMVNSLTRRLRSTLGNMVQAEVELLGAFKDNTALREQRDALVLELRTVFDRARVECRNHFTRSKADQAGFPARMAEDAGSLLRQTKLVSWTLRKADFDLGASVIPDSTVTAKSLLRIFEPKVVELEEVLASAVRRKARTRGKQVVKDKELSDFRTTYSIFVALIRGSFRLAGQDELANRLTLNQIGTRTSRPLDPPQPPFEGEGEEETQDEEPIEPDGGEPSEDGSDSEPGDSDLDQG